MACSRMITAVLLLVAAPLQAQSDPLLLDGRLLPLRADTFAIFLVEGADTTPIGWASDALLAEGDQLRRIFSSEDLLFGTQFDTIISRLSDLRPVEYRGRSTHRHDHLTYDSSAVTGWSRHAGGDTIVISVPVPFPIYDGNSFDLIARASPLRDSFQLTVTTYLVGNNAVASLHGAVVGSAMVDGHPCWVFKAAFASMPVTFWIDKETRALRRQLMQVRVDMGILYTSPPGPEAPFSRAT